MKKNREKMVIQVLTDHLFEEDADDLDDLDFLLFDCRFTFLTEEPFCLLFELDDVRWTTFISLYPAFGAMSDHRERERNNNHRRKGDLQLEQKSK